MAGRVLADLGADVVLVEPPDGHPLRARRHTVGPRGPPASVPSSSTVPTTPDSTPSSAPPTSVIDTPGAPGAFTLDPGRAPAVRVGERHAVRSARDHARRGAPPTSACSRPAATCTRPATRTARPCAAPSRPVTRTPVARPRSQCSPHAGPVVRSASTSRCRKCVDVANMASPARFDQSGFRGRRLGAHIGRTREIWPTKDGWVSFGLRGGKARIPSLQIITKAVADDGIDASALEAQDWAEWSPAHAPDEVLRADRGTDRQVLLASHDAGALRPRVRDEPDARAGELTARDPRQRPARRPRVLRAAR